MLANKTRIRVLIVDDSIVVRRHLESVLGHESDIEIFPAASSGHVALNMIAAHCPDIVVLDVRMDYIDGFEVLQHIRRRENYLPVIIYTAWNNDSAVSLKSMRLGADDCVSKPTQVHSQQDAINYVRRTLLPKIRRFAKPHRPLKPCCVQTVKPNSQALANKIQILAIGASTGGPDAITYLLKSISKPLPVPVVIVQHMPPMFTHMFATRLNARTVHTVRESVSHQWLCAGDVWIAAGNYHMEVRKSGNKTMLKNHQEALENSTRPAVDVLFRSVVKLYGAGVLAVVLTGMGKDGLQGCRAIRAQGGEVIVQDKASSAVWGMPQAVAGDGLANAVLPLNMLPTEILRRVCSSKEEQP